MKICKDAIHRVLFLYGCDSLRPEIAKKLLSVVRCLLTFFIFANKF